MLYPVLIQDEGRLRGCQFLKVSWDYFYLNLSIYFFSTIKFYLGDFIDTRCLGAINKLDRHYKNSYGKSLNIYLINEGNYYKFPTFDFSTEYFNGTSLSYDLVQNNSFFFTLGLDLRLEMPIYNLILRQRLKINYDTNILSLGSKSISTNNVFSNNFKEFIRFCEGNRIYVL